MSYRKSFLMLLVFPAILLSLLAFCVLYVDPVQIFSKGYFIEEKFDRNLRQQNRGIIANVDFDGAILGTSMLQNTSAMETSSLLGGKWVNISMSGANFYERSKVLHYLVKNKKIESIVYSFDSFTLENAYTTKPSNARWPMLYSDSIYESTMYYYNMKNIKRSLRCLYNFQQTKATIDFFDHPTEWATNSYNSCRFGGLENWIVNMDKQGIRKFITEQLAGVVRNGIHIPSQIVCDEKLRMQYIQYIDNNVMTFVKYHPETDFHIIIPPYFRYRYAVMRQVNGSDFVLHQEAIRHIINASAKYPNLRVYGFEDMDFLDDIANYKDTSHYHQSINSMMMHAIADETHILTPENLEPYLAKCDELAQAFDIRKLYEDACVLMVKHGIDPKTGKKIQ